MTAFSLFSEHLKVTSSLILRSRLKYFPSLNPPKVSIPELTVFSPTRPDFTLSQLTPSTEQSRGCSITNDTRWRMSVGGLSGSKLGWRQTTVGLISDNGACYLKIKISNASQVKHLEIPVLSSQNERESHLKAWWGPYQGLHIPQKQLSNTKSPESAHPTQPGPLWTVWRERISSKETMIFFFFFLTK